MNPLFGFALKLTTVKCCVGTHGEHSARTVCLAIDRKAKQRRRLPQQFQER